MKKKKFRKVEIIEEIVFETQRVVCRDERLACALGLAPDNGWQTADGWMRPWERRVTAALASGIVVALVVVWVWIMR